MRIAGVEVGVEVGLNGVTGCTQLEAVGCVASTGKAACEACAGEHQSMLRCADPATDRILSMPSHRSTAPT